MSGYSRSCSRADSSILLVAQCAAALSIMPASAPSCWTQGVTAASYNEYAILVSPWVGDFIGETIGEARSSCQPGVLSAIGWIVATPLALRARPKSPRVPQRAVARVGLRAAGELAVEPRRQRPVRVQIKVGAGRGQRRVFRQRRTVHDETR